MNVSLLHNSPLTLTVKATRKCWDSMNLSDSDGEAIGSKDCALIDRVANKFKHESVKNHVYYTFDIEGISTKTLLALTRHDIGTEFSVQSTRYTTSKRSDKLKFTETRSEWVNDRLQEWLEVIKEGIAQGISDDDLAMMLPQAYQYSLVMTISMQALQHFLNLRLKKDAHYDIVLLAIHLYEEIPEEHLFMFTDQRPFYDGALERLKK